MARRRSPEDGATPNVGVVMSTSLFLIILTFFILLCSIAVIDEAKTRVAIGSLIGSFGSLPKGLSPLDTGRSIMPLSAPMVEEHSGIDRIISGIDKETLGRLKIERLGNKQVITVDGSLLFEQDSHMLKPGSHVLLGKLGRTLGEGDSPVEIVGHTDNTSGRVKGYRSNWELSALSALEVVKHFVERGIAPTRFTACGAGGEKPFLSNATRESRERNKRIEIVVYDGAADLKRRYEGEPPGLFIYKRFDFKVF